MKYPQTISIAGANPDTSLVVIGADVIDDTTQTALTVAVSPITIDIDFYDVTAGSAVATVSSVTMTYNSASGFWSIPVSSISSALTDRHKYVAKISEHSGGTANMRDFYLTEFGVDNNSFEETLMRLPFKYSFGTPSYITWYEDTTWAVAKFRAEIYEGSTGTTAATDATKVTHRGPIEAI